MVLDIFEGCFLVKVLGPNHIFDPIFAKSLSWKVPSVGWFRVHPLIENVVLLVLINCFFKKNSKKTGDLAKNGTKKLSSTEI